MKHLTRSAPARRVSAVRPQAKTVTIHGLPDLEPIHTVHVSLNC